MTDLALLGERIARTLLETSPEPDAPLSCSFTLNRALLGLGQREASIGDPGSDLSRSVLILSAVTPISSSRR
jgi:hypothetical protein